MMNIGSQKATDHTMDRLAMLIGVFFFGFMAYLLSDTHFVFAIVCVFFAATVPYMVRSTRRAKDRLFGSHSDDEK